MGALSRGLASAVMVLVLTPAGVGAQEEVAALREQIEAERALILEQQQALAAREQRLDDLSRRLAVIEGKAATRTRRPGSSDDAAASSGATTAAPLQRDSVGDLNSDAIRAGEFPGSIQLPGSGNVSLAIGGFIKAVAIADSDAEAAGAAFLPAFLGTARSDVRGNSSIDSTLSRIFFDARSSASRGDLRGYLEFDLNGSGDGSASYKVRHAYGAWDTGRGKLTAGQTWSTLMDLKILPNGLTEPTVSGAIFQRQPLLRWSQPIGGHLNVDLALEDPTSSDVLRDDPSFVARVAVADVVGAVEADWDGGHIRVGGIARDLTVDTGAGSEATSTGWGVALSGHQRLFARDKLYAMLVYGEGLGRYLLGLQSAAAGAIDPAGELNLRKNYGGLVGYQHHWSEKLSSTAAMGRARMDALDFEPGGSFEGSTYIMGNFMWQVLPYLSFGVEYSYGRRSNDGAPDLDNHRISIGTQIF